MKWAAVFFAVCLVAFCVAPVDAGCHQGVQVFQAPAVQTSAVFAQPVCAVQSFQAVQQPVYQTQQVVQVPVQAPVVFQQAYAVQAFAVAQHPVVQQVNVVRNRQPRVTRSVAKVRTRR